MFLQQTAKWFLLVTILCFFYAVSNASAVTILSESGKKNIDTNAAAATPPPSTRPAATILGKYKDISAVKRANSSYHVSKSRTNVVRNLSAKCAIIIDSANGKTLFSRNPDTPRQPASTIKVLTGMIALKSLEMDTKVGVSSKAAKQPRSKVYLDQRKKYLADDLINAVLLASANDASVALAEKIAGSETSFAKMMTLRAQLWGAKHTVCKTATGLTARGQSSTARDLAMIFRHAMSDPDFAARMKQATASTTDGKLLHNHNKALWQVEGAQGGKTGYTNAARQTYVGKFKRGSDEIIVAIMGSERMWNDLKTLVAFGFKTKELARAESKKTSIHVADSAQ